MINVMTWVRGEGGEGRGSHFKHVDNANHEITLNYLRAQVDNALQVGWKPEQIKVYTNFRFQHMGVRSRWHRNVFPKNSWQNKWTAVQQTMKEHSPCPDIYFHDIDAFQTGWIDFPKDIHGHDIRGMAMATSYNPDSPWNAGVAFMKGECVSGLLRRYFQASDKRKRVTNDEHIWHEVSQQRRLRNLFQLLPRKYNVAEGQYWTKAWNECGGDVQILHIKPHQLFRRWHWYNEGSSRRTMAYKLTPPRLKELFNKYSLWHPDNEKDFTNVPLPISETGDKECPSIGDTPVMPMLQSTPNEAPKS